MAFRVYKKNCCGLDVHKTWIYACIGITDDKGLTEYYRERFTSFHKGLLELVSFLKLHDCKEVCMESSGKYWIPVFNVLEEHINVVLAHPKYTKSLKGNKTDRMDAKRICDLFMCDMIRSSFIPPADIRQLRDLIRYRFKLTNITTGEKNRAQNCLTVSNMKLDDVFSDVFGKSSKAIIAYILAHPDEKFDVAPFVDRRCKTPIEEIQAAVDGAICESQAVKLRVILRHLDELAEDKSAVEAEILRLAEPYSAQLELLCTVPGLDADPMTRITILSEIGADMSVFPTAKNLMSWAGVCPRNDSSGGKRKSNRISRAGCYLKPLLVQVANAVIRSKTHPEFGERYRRIKARRGHKKAIIAVCRMLLTAIWNILKKNEPYSDKGFLVDYSPQNPTQISEEVARKYLLSRGFVIANSAPPPIPVSVA
jgi:transposase